MLARPSAPSPAPRLFSRLVAPAFALVGVALAPTIASASESESIIVPPAWMSVFFVAMLLSIAIIPLTKMSHWWENNLNKLLLGLALAAYPLMWLIVTTSQSTQVLHTVEEYAQFIILLGTLFYISGGIFLAGDLKGTPATNTVFLGIGTLIASVVGTTGASMLLIRPVLRMNGPRQNKVHVVIFFIFLVSNVGGSLTPLGDPPLFLGYLRGVPFEWTLGLYKQMALVAGILLVLFYALDNHFYKKESPQAAARQGSGEPLRIEGMINLVWLAGIVACVAFIRPEHGRFVREAAMLGCAVASRFTSPADTRKKNEFTWYPILEVAALFIGIFLTMIPALMVLKASGDQLGVNTPARFFWAAGSLSSFLDNAPTYLVFFNTAQGMVERGQLLEYGTLVVGVPQRVLEAVSCGAVFMGANTYIGNGPNFMVKAIAEAGRVEMPSFFGYMKWSVAILIPCFILTTFVYFM